MKWKASEFWKDEEVYIIGGGTSLSDFNWDVLKDKHTIGCNSAFRLGDEVCDICVFGDAAFFRNFRSDLEKFNGLVVTNHPSLTNNRIPWLKGMERMKRGLSTVPHILGWNKNTGAAAVNLALLLGAKRIYLLGFDMQPSKDNHPNWHNYIIQKLYPGVYDLFIQHFARVKSDLQSKFPGREVINVNDNSRLECFPKISPTEIFGDKL